MSDTAQALVSSLTANAGNKVLASLQAMLGASWDELTPSERTDVTRLMFAITRAHFLELIGQDVTDELRILGVAFDQWKVVGKQVVIDGVRKVASEAFGLAGTFAGSALAAAVKGAM